MMYSEQPEPGKKKALVLAIAVHLVLALCLFLGVQWKTKHAAVEVELWSPPEPQQSRPAPPPPKPAPPPPEPQTQPEPTPEKPDMLVKDDKKPVAKPTKPIPEPPKKPNPIKDLQRELEQETRQIEQNKRLEEEIQRNKANESARLAARKAAESQWMDKIGGKIRGNIVLPLQIQGNPTAVFLVSILPTGEIIGSPKLKKSSGNSALDDAIERAISKSSPLPKPDDPSVFVRELEINYRPYD